MTGGPSPLGRKRQAVQSTRTASPAIQSSQSTDIPIQATTRMRTSRVPTLRNELFALPHVLVNVIASLLIVSSPTGLRSPGISLQEVEPRARRYGTVARRSSLYPHAVAKRCQRS